MPRRHLLLSIVALAGAARPAGADDGQVLALDEAAFLARMAQTDPRLDGLAAEAEAAEADVLAAAARAEPRIAVEREALVEGPNASTSYARIEVPVALSGARERRIAAARTEVAAVRADGARARLVIVVEALEHYYQAAHARRYAETLRAERDALVRVVEIVRKRAGAGASSGYDLQRFELELAAYDDLLLTADTRLLEARGALAALAGGTEPLIDASSDLTLPRRPPPLPELVATALEHRDDHRAATLRAVGARQRRAAAARAWVPGLELSAGMMAQTAGDERALGYTVGVALSLPIFDRGRAAKARAAAAHRAALAETRGIERRAAVAVRAGHATLERRITQAETLAAVQLARLDTLLRSAETAYREGDGSVVELLDAYQTARDTRLRDLELRRDARLAELQLWLASGVRP